MITGLVLLVSSAVSLVIAACGVCVGLFGRGRLWTINITFSHDHAAWAAFFLLVSGAAQFSMAMALLRAAP